MFFCSVEAVTILQSLSGVPGKITKAKKEFDRKFGDELTEGGIVGPGRMFFIKTLTKFETHGTVENLVRHFTCI